MARDLLETLPAFSSVLQRFRSVRPRRLTQIETRPLKRHRTRNNNLAGLTAGNIRAVPGREDATESATTRTNACTRLRVKSRHVRALARLAVRK